MTWLRGLVFLAVGATVLSSCAPTQQTRTAEKSGFLRDYSMLREGKEGEAQLVYINKSANWASYKKVIVDPVTIWLGEESQLKEIEPEDRQRLANELWAKLRDTLKHDYEIAHTPGLDVMRIQAAITEAEASNPALDTISSVIPQLRLLTGAKGVIAGGQPGFVGEASIEVKITDSRTGTLLGAGVDQRAGTKSISGSTDSWHDVDEAYQYWAYQIRYRLCTLRGGTDCITPDEARKAE